MRPIGWALIGVLLIGGVYFLVFHKDLPLNHESVGLGTFHALHDVVGVVLLGLAGFIWWRSRRQTKASIPPGS